MSIPHSPTPDWAAGKIQTVIDNSEPEALEAALELLAAVCPTEDQDKFKHEAAWAAIDLGYQHTEDCKRSARRHFSAASLLFALLNLGVQMIHNIPQLLTVSG